MCGECREGVVSPSAKPAATRISERRGEVRPIHVFVYDIRLSSDELARVAPGAVLVAPAHLGETRLVFTIPGPDGRRLPSIRPETGHTVWGAVFDVPEAEVAALDEAQRAEGRVRVDGRRAVDREGTSYEVFTHLADGETGDEGDPSPAYLGRIVAGSREVGLPAGWVIGLEELAGPAT